MVRIMPRRITISLCALLNFLPILTQAVDTIDYQSCAAAATALLLQDPDSISLLDANGHLTKTFSKAIEITYETCKIVCQGGAKGIEWNSFSLQFASYLLPWLALAAQLPFEMRSGARNA